MRKEKRKLFMILAASLSMVSIVAFGAIKLSKTKKEEIPVRSKEKVESKKVTEEPPSPLKRVKVHPLDGTYYLNQIACLDTYKKTLTSEGLFKDRREGIFIEDGKMTRVIHTKKDCYLMETKEFDLKPRSIIIRYSNIETVFLMGNSKTCKFSLEVESPEGRIKVVKKEETSKGEDPKRSPSSKEDLLLHMDSETFMIPSNDHVDSFDKSNRNTCFYVYLKGSN